MAIKLKYQTEFPNQDVVYINRGYKRLNIKYFDYLTYK